MMRRLPLFTTLLFALVATVVPAPADANEFSVLEEAECTGMRVRLEPSIHRNETTGSWEPWPHHYRLLLLDGEQCNRTYVKASTGFAEPSHARFVTHVFRDGIEDDCEGSDCWPRLCAGAVTGSFGADIRPDHGGPGGSTFWVGSSPEPRGAHVFQLNPGSAAPSRLIVRGFDNEVGVVAIAGEFTRVGGCDETGAEFEGSMVFYDPRPPTPDQLRELLGV